MKEGLICNAHNVSFDEFLSGFIVNAVLIIKLLDILPEIIVKYQIYA